ncbi:MAG TPA: hypothetical protein VHT75_17115 [Acidimicrobiales bacterium]|jgi:hypothetical protein|nr:hypothetical protein [Acidimicrobiales bacterium]
MTDTPNTEGHDDESDPAGGGKTTVPGQSAGADAKGEGDSEGGTLEDKA